LFKPQPDQPIEVLWRVAPEQTTRMFKSSYYGLVTRPETLDYNRYCHYGWSDSEKKPAMAFAANHAGFASIGAILIHWWGFHFSRTGDRDSLGWAQAMADKWQAVQHPITGLLPHWFGGDCAGDPVQPPRPYANNQESRTATTLLKAARELRK